MIDLEWRKARRSSFEGNCVEVRRDYAGVLVCNSRFPSVVLRFNQKEWAAFLDVPRVASSTRCSGRTAKIFVGWR